MSGTFEREGARGSLQPRITRPITKQDLPGLYLLHDGCSLPPTRAGKAPCVALDVTAPSLSDLRRVYGLEKPPAFSSCISPIKELIPCSTSRFTASPHPSCQGCFFFLVFRGEHFPHFAILIWTPGLEITACNCENGLTFIVLTRCLLSTIDLFKKGYKPEL